jgi:hypothetical protein
MAARDSPSGAWDVSRNGAWRGFAPRHRGDGGRSGNARLGAEGALGHGSQLRLRALCQCLLRARLAVGHRVQVGLPAPVCLSVCLSVCLCLLIRPKRSMPPFPSTARGGNGSRSAVNKCASFLVCLSVCLLV